MHKASRVSIQVADFDVSAELAMTAAKFHSYITIAAHHQGAGRQLGERRRSLRRSARAHHHAQGHLGQDPACHGAGRRRAARAPLAFGSLWDRLP